MIEMIHTPFWHQWLPNATPVDWILSAVFFYLVASFIREWIEYGRPACPIEDRFGFFACLISICLILALLTGCHDADDRAERIADAIDNNTQAVRDQTEAQAQSAGGIQDSIRDAGQGIANEVGDEGDDIEEAIREAASSSTGTATNDIAGIAADGRLFVPNGCVRLDNAGVGQGFVWKPISEGDGNLVVLFPPSFVVARCILVPKAEIDRDDPIAAEIGIPQGRTQEDLRFTFRFERPGCGYMGYELRWFGE